MTKDKSKIASVLIAWAATAALAACSPTEKTDSNLTDANTAVQAAPDAESGNSHESADIARDMHDQMNRDSSMHDSMKDGSMSDDQMGQMGTGGMKGKGMGPMPTTDAPPKDKADPMPPMDHM